MSDENQMRVSASPALLVYVKRGVSRHGSRKGFVWKDAVEGDTRETWVKRRGVL